MKSPLKLAAFRISANLLTALASIKARDGISVSEQVRRALESWVTGREIRPAAKKAARKRAATRNRA